MSLPKLTAKQQRFVDEYMVDLNATQAAIRAGYSKRSAAEAGYENLRKPQIAAAVAARQSSIAAELKVTVDDIARELHRGGFANMFDYLRVGKNGDPFLDFSGLTRELAAPIAEVVVDDYVDGRGDDAREVRRVRFKLLDKRACLVDLAKLLGFWKERQEVDAGASFLECVTQVANEHLARWREECARLHEGTCGQEYEHIRKKEQAVAQPARRAAGTAPRIEGDAYVL